MRFVDGRWGRTYFIGKDEYVGRSLFHYGEYGPDETEMILSLATGLCLDIGANFGVIGQALEANGFSVLAFEPQPDVFNILQKNIRGGCYNTAIGSSTGFEIMPKVLYGSRANYGGMSCGTSSILGSIRVPIITIDSLNLDSVGFMKIDVEGFEEQVLRGAVETIARCRPIMYIEDDRPENRKSLRAFIVELGYSIEEHQPKLYRENNFFGLKKNIWDKDYESHNLICRPC